MKQLIAISVLTLVVSSLTACGPTYVRGSEVEGLDD